MNLVCDKAKDRIDRLEEQEKYLLKCFKHLICPKCGSDVDKKQIYNRECYLKYTYKCTECDWQTERNT